VAQACVECRSDDEHLPVGLVVDLRPHGCMEDVARDGLVRDDEETLRVGTGGGHGNSSLVVVHDREAAGAKTWVSPR
jgi:hypothetical protein